jgi:hypothetical protein
MSQTKKDPKKGKNDKDEAPIVPEVVINYGSGSFSFPDGSRYEGEYSHIGEASKMRHGKGSYVNGPERYSGEWSGDKMNGQGTYEFASGAVYKGHFRQGMFDGEGTYRFADGASYTGMWHANKMHGSGEYMDAEKVKWAGEFFNGCFDSGRSFISLRPSQGL